MLDDEFDYNDDGALFWPGDEFDDLEIGVRE